jgi:hypothetical protein
MKKNSIGIVILVALGLLAIFACNQDPIFYIIAKETAPQRPRIEGAPTNMVVFEREYNDPDNPGEKKRVPIMYVASGRLHWYARAGKGVGVSSWDSFEYYIPQPTETKIISLAVTPTRLYALCFDDQNSTNAILRYIEFDTNVWAENAWKVIPSNPLYPPIQSIYTDPKNERLFAGVRRGNTSGFAILYLDDNDTLQIFKHEAGLLSGVIYREQDSSFYLCTLGDIFQVHKDTITTYNLLLDSVSIMGMIKLEDADETIIAVARGGGYLYEITPELKLITYFDSSDNYMQTGGYATGALALWEGPADSHPEATLKKLIAGVQGRLSSSSSSSSYTHGYVEFLIDGNGLLNTNFLRGDSKTGTLQSVHDNDRYTASLGKHPINHLFQTPPEIDEKRIFFASTQTAGLWSYRNRTDGGWQWNAEE